MVEVTREGRMSKNTCHMKTQISRGTLSFQIKLQHEFVISERGMKYEA